MSVLPLIVAQPGIFVADQLSKFDNAYVVVHYLEMNGKVDVPVLFNAIHQGMDEVDTLKMDYTTDRRGDAIQILRGSELLPTAEFIDLRSNDNPVLASKAIMDEDMNKPVRIDTGVPLIRHVIMQLENEKFIWYQRYHHIQVDAFSFTALTRRMGAIYSSQIRGIDLNGSEFANGSSAPNPIELAVREYEQYQASAKYTKDAKFWKTYCATLPEAASISPLPLNAVEPSKHIIRNHTFLSGDHFTKMCSDMSSSGTSSNLSQVDFALALVSVWLLRLCNRSELTCGFIFMRRLGSAALNTSGPFINVLPLPLKFTSGKMTLAELAQEISNDMRQIRRHQKYDSEKIVRDSNRSWESDPLFGPVINLKAFDYGLDFDGIETVTHHVASGPVRDLELVLYINDDGSIRVEYLANATRYDATTLDRHLQRLHLLLEQFSSDISLACSSATILLTEEILQIDRINQTNTDTSSFATERLMDLVLRQAQNTPDSIALQDDSVEFTEGLKYCEMINQVCQLANLLENNGVKPGDIVAVALPRSVYLSLAIQAISVAGGTWLPLDPSYPSERLRLMIEDARPSLLIVSDETLLSNLVSEPKLPVIVYNKLLSVGNDVATNREIPKTPAADNAYIIYTSGSTGKPKGVVLPHKAIVNRLLWMKDAYNIESSDSILQKTSACFDVSVWEFFLPLISGARLVMAPPDAHRDPSELQRLVGKFGITTLHFVPSMLSTFVTHFESDDDMAWSGTLKRTFCSGEALSTNLSRAWEKLVNVPLYNLYGPTEAAIDVTAYPAFGSALESITSAAYVPIGLPVWNTQVHVFDSNLRLLPEGVAGDLYISGVQLAWGYLNLPELTNDRFVNINGVRMYKTGDIARWLENGKGLEFLGRSDDQVKLRGQRIELGEIDAVLENIDGVKQAITLALSNPKIGGKDVDSRQLVSYFVGSADPVVLRENVATTLPAYMVPTKIINIESFPISASGKLDRRSLPPAFENSTGDAEHETKQLKRLPCPGLEQDIADSFQDIIGCDSVSAEDDFFSLGGHSLMAVKLVTQLRAKLNLPVTIGQIMQHPRVDSLAVQLSDVSGQDKWKDAGFEDVLDMSSTKDAGRNIFCIHPASGFSWQFSVLRRYLDPRWKLIGIQSAREDGPLGSASSLDDVIEQHLATLLNAQPPDVPYYLLGYSLGGTLAHSLAARLVAAGRSVAFLGLLDTWPPETQNWNAKSERKEVDQAVIDEMQRERQQFLSASSGDLSSRRMFDVIETNYASAVKILATAASSKFAGRSTLFVAKKTLPENTDLEEVWKPYTNDLETVPVDCSHVDIVSPVVFQILGLQINDILRRY